MGRVAEIAKTLDLTDQLPPLTEDALPSIRAMRTVLKKRNFDFFLAENTQSVDLDFVQRLEEHILETTSCIGQKSDDLLLKYFNSIQLWGGKTGRNIYVRDGGIQINLCLKNYRTLITACHSQGRISDIFDATRNFLDATKNFGTAFVTKHTRFLTSVNPQFGGLPIYDSIIATKLYSRRQVQVDHVVGYWNEMLEVARQKNCNLLVLERAIFNHLRTQPTIRPT